MTDSVMIRRHAALLLAAAMPAFALTAAPPALAEPAQAGADAGKPTYYYYTYTKRWPVEGSDAADCTDVSADGPLPAGRYRAQIVRFARVSNASDKSDVVAVRFGLSIEPAGTVQRIADITTEPVEQKKSSKNPLSGKDKSPISPINQRQNQKIFRDEFSHIVLPLINGGGSQEKSVDPIKLMTLLCGSGKNLNTYGNVSAVNINHLLSSKDALAPDDFAMIMAFYDPINILNGAVTEQKSLALNLENYDGFVLAGFVGALVSEYHRELYLAFRNDLQRSIATSGAGIAPPAKNLSQFQAQQASSPPSSPEVSRSSFLWDWTTSAFTLLVGLFGVLLCGWFVRDHIRMKAQLTDKIHWMEKDLISNHLQRLDAMNDRLDTLWSGSIKSSNVISNINQRVSLLEGSLTSIKSEYQDGYDPAWRDEFRKFREDAERRSQKLQTAMQKLSDDLARMNRSKAEATGQSPSTTGALRARAEARDAGEGILVAAAADGPAQALSDPPDSLTDLERITGIPVSRAQLAKDLGEDCSSYDLLRWLVERYLPKRCEPALYEQVGAWLSEATKGHAELIIPAANAVYEKELHDIGGYGPPRYGSLDPIVGLACPGLRIKGQTVLKPQVIIPS